MKSSRTVRVNLGSQSYDIVVGSGLLASAGELIRRHLNPTKVIVLADKNSDRLYGRRLEASLKAAGFSGSTFVIEAGESSKSFATYQVVAEKIISLKPERKTLIIALGGGVVGDLSGFVASTTLRGVDFVQIPTTLLSMVDSSVGGKNGINTKYGKNLIGTFYQPKLVIADTDVLSSLPRRELMAGYAEVVKYGLINDAVFFGWLELNAADAMAGDDEKLQHIVAKSCEAKAFVVERDEKESGLRMLLNLGHTFGHAFEAITGFSSKLRHGEAVAIGMVMAFEYSHKLGFCEQSDVERIRQHFKALKLFTSASDAKIKTSADEVLKYMYQDKKASGGRLRLVLAKGIGKSFVYDEKKPDVFREYLKASV